MWFPEIVIKGTYFLPKLNLHLYNNILGYLMRIWVQWVFGGKDAQSTLTKQFEHLEILVKYFKICLDKLFISSIIGLDEMMYITFPYRATFPIRAETSDTQDVKYCALRSYGAN